MDFHDGIVLLPYTKVFEVTYKCSPNFDNLINKLSVQKSSIHNLFYDGKWQRTVSGITRYAYFFNLYYNDSLKFKMI